jgi:very-short-patch-repair endonuclease
MLKYNAGLKNTARLLRKHLTDSEEALWSRLRRKQLLGVQFYRQKPIDDYLVDFFAPTARLVVEVDGSQHLVVEHAQKDRIRDAKLASLGLRVLRFNSREVLMDRDAVVQTIYRTLTEYLNMEIPPDPPLTKGGIGKKGYGIER